MPYSDGEVRRQLRLGEDSGWEFKEVGFRGNRPVAPRRDDWADEIAAFANSDGGALLCGVSDDGEVQGMSRERMDELERLIFEVCSDSINPPVRVRIFRREIAEGKAYLMVEVPEGDAQHDSPGGSYARVGSSKRLLSGEERLRLAQRRSQARFRWFDEQTVDGTGFGALDAELWRPLLSVEGAASPELALEKMGLLAPDENGVTRATVAGILLCSNSPEEWLPNACVMATRYRGADRASGQIDAQTITGPLDRQIAQALAFATRNMSVAAVKEPARRDIPQYSVNALFEALVNAVAHRDYSIRGSRIRLSMFEDRLELCSPGSLPNNLTIESMGERQSTRNEALTSMLGRMPVRGIGGSAGRQFFMERRGDGVPIIQRTTRELCGRSPEYRLTDGSELCLTIPSAPAIMPDPTGGDFANEPTETAFIAARSGGSPIAGADVLAIFPNRTFRHSTANENGEAFIDLYLNQANLPITVFVASDGFSARVERDWVPSRRALSVEVELDPLPEGGSLIFPEEIGDIPGLAGRLNPIRDRLDRVYLYTSNIAINGGKPQPVYFTFGEDLLLTDSLGNEALARFVDIVGRSALLEYRHKAKNTDI